MFRRQEVNLIGNPVCERALTDINPKDFEYYDKDGFELNIIEQKYYSAMGYPLHHNCLNHVCYQEPWFTLDPHDRLILDHSLILHRCSYIGEARKQLDDLQHYIPRAYLIAHTQQKWGFDFALDAVSEDGTVYEVLHVEIDSNSYEDFVNKKVSFEYTIRHTDWVRAAEQIWQNRDQWQKLKGFAQNDWKAKCLLNWNKAEYTEKTV